MKNHLVITIIVLLLCLTSCGIGKRTLSQEVQADVERQAYDSIELSKEIESIIEATVAEALSKEVSFNVTDERRIWSPPDSSGKQFIIVERIVRTSAEAQELTHKTETSVKGTSQHIDSTTVAASIVSLRLWSQLTCFTETIIIIELIRCRPLCRERRICDYCIKLLITQFISLKSVIVVNLEIVVSDTMKQHIHSAEVECCRVLLLTVNSVSISLARCS